MKVRKERIEFTKLNISLELLDQHGIYYRLSTTTKVAALFQRLIVTNAKQQQIITNGYCCLLEEESSEVRNETKMHLKKK